MNTNLTSCISDKIMLTTEKRAQVTISALRSFAVKRLNELWLVLSRSLLWQKCWMLFHTEVKYQKLLLFVNCAIYLVILSSLLFESQQSGYTRVPPGCGSSNSVGKMSKFWHCTFATRLMTMRCCSRAGKFHDLRKYVCFSDICCDEKWMQIFLHSRSF